MPNKRQRGPRPANPDEEAISLDMLLLQGIA